MEKLFEKLFALGADNQTPNIPREQSFQAFAQLYPKLMPKPENAVHRLPLILTTFELCWKFFSIIDSDQVWFKKSVKIVFGSCTDDDIV